MSCLDPVNGSSDAVCHRGEDIGGDGDASVAAGAGGLASHPQTRPSRYAVAVPHSAARVCCWEVCRSGSKYRMGGECVESGARRAVAAGAVTLHAHRQRQRTIDTHRAR
eukprot:1090584-Rhodomonas_salina.3